MARRLGARKRPDREVHMIKEQLKIEEGIFDRKTMMALWKMFNHQMITQMDYMIKGGKEADVYLADGGPNAHSQYVALKIFRVETSDFNKRMMYISGDPRFEKIKGDILSIVKTWCKKEYGNLMIAELADVHAPKPYYFKDNVLAMEFIGDGSVAAPTLRKYELKEPARALDTILSDMEKLYAMELVHADISEYNILVKDEVPYLIDFGQAVSSKHPKADQFLERDITNLLYYFAKKYGIERNNDEVFAKIKGTKSAF
ncbi:MAG: serine protein kinase RIO [Candidatus Micrarchaeota archaeon]|nr:serine protein kinase RIO [Candidatus Micrarchaeota archaeon]MDE1833948.1 serine protein kinase RIO [Candidatus Micrarchaeota archaeon]MDE1859824.1 serine protein kinase RIO [Candidatus Micrarchaeota archaeon]